MVVIYKTASPRYVKLVEDDLILHGWDRYWDTESWNWRRGGAGRLSEYDKYYYVYVLLE